MFAPTDLLNYGALGLAMAVLMLSIAILFKVLQWAHAIFDSVLSRIEANTGALTRLSERLQGSGEVDE